ncbi:exosome complex component 10 homolog isoform X2 [Epargyreus clarus]|uniref:exosome complex component 10 homolog isoform X2 n=1 Tax=Epargyreus clarus TaxID=520877 RepID=UPI003C2BE073
MNSVLNPEAPEFYPDLTSFTKVPPSIMSPLVFYVGDTTHYFDSCPENHSAYKTIYNTVVTSNSFPSEATYKFLKTFTDFNIVTCKLSESFEDQSNQIIITEFPNMALQKNDMEYNKELLVDTNDRILDRIQINIDTLNNVNTVSDQLLDGMKLNSDVNRPVIEKIRLGSTMLISAKNITRPQLTFKDTVDNSENLWVPKISDKPNNIKPLALNIIYDEKGEAVGYEHPYKVELDLYEPPPEFIEPDLKPLPFPEKMEVTKFAYIDTEAELDKLVEHLNTVSEIAVDVEHHAYRTYQGITCLIQITTTEGGDFVIDALALREHIHKLNLSFTDPRKIKVFHGADMDVLWLQRDFGVYIVGLFDTYQAAKMLNLTGLALKHVLKQYCNVNADKKYQLADWRMRPLPGELVEYARQDTHYLLYVWRRMRCELLDAATGQDNLLRAVFKNSKLICGSTYRKFVVDDNSHMSIYLRSKRVFNTRQMAALKLLFKWRDSQARILDESVTYLIPNHMLIALAEALPREMQGVNACCSPMPPFVKQNMIAIHRMILSCREIPLDSIAYSTPTPSCSGYQGPAYQFDVHDGLYTKFDNINVQSTIESTNDINENDQILTIPPKHEDNFVSTLNANAKMYIPPYYRYRGYRFLAKDEEIRKLEEKEAKVTAIAQGDPLIKSEVLLKLQESKNNLIQEDKEETEQDHIFLKKVVQRKRKMSTETTESKDETNAQEEPIQEVDKQSSNDAEIKLNSTSDNKADKTFNYKQVNYKKFHNECEQSRKQPKMKFKKHK